MNSIWKVSDAEVSSAIRYLDPDFQNDSRMRGGLKLHITRRVTAAMVILSILVIACVTVLKYLPLLMRLLS